MMKYKNLEFGSATPWLWEIGQVSESQFPHLENGNDDK